MKQFEIGDKVRKTKGHSWSRDDICYGIVKKHRSPGCVTLDVYSQTNKLIREGYSAFRTTLEKVQARHHPLTNIFR